MKTRDSEMSRRHFLSRAAVAAGAAAVAHGCGKPQPPKASPGPQAASDWKTTPGNRVTLGFIGTGSHGIDVNLKNFLSQEDAQVVALCDVDEGRLRQAEDIVKQEYGARRPGGTWRGVAATGDWHEIVARDDIDAVVISTPDHWHAPISMAAMRAGKHVFCEKPISLTVQEGRVVADAVARYGRIFQIGTPNRSRRTFHHACELVRNGRIGKLHTIRLNVARGHGESEVEFHPDSTPRPVPPGFNYDMWLGQAPYAPYVPERCHFRFRYNFDYSGGNVTDFGAHYLDVAQWGNDTEHTGPVSVDGKGVFPRDGLYDVATDWEILYEYANGVRLVFKSGGFGIRFEGDQGWVEADNVNIRASSPGILNSVIGPEEIRLRTCAAGEQRDFLNCLRTMSEPYAPAEIEHRSITLGHIGNISMRLGRKLTWDPVQEQFVADEEANRMLSRSMRAPVTL